MVEVTQEDREAAANYLAVTGGTTWGLEYIRDGMDDDSFPVQAFARHRIAAENAALERAAKVCEDQRAVFASEEYSTGQPLGSLAERFACTRCAEAIRAMKGPSNA